MIEACKLLVAKLVAFFILVRIYRYKEKVKHFQCQKWARVGSYFTIYFSGTRNFKFATIRKYTGNGSEFWINPEIILIKDPFFRKVSQHRKNSCYRCCSTKGLVTVNRIFVTISRIFESASCCHGIKIFC